MPSEKFARYLPCHIWSPLKITRYNSTNDIWKLCSSVPFCVSMWTAPHWFVVIIILKKEAIKTYADEHVHVLVKTEVLKRWKRLDPLQFFYRYWNVLGECHTDYSNLHTSGKTNSSGKNLFGWILISFQNSQTTSVYWNGSYLTRVKISRICIDSWLLACVMKQYFLLNSVFNINNRNCIYMYYSQFIQYQAQRGGFVFSGNILYQSHLF